MDNLRERVEQAHALELEKAIAKVTERYEIQARRQDEEIRNLHNQKITCTIL